MRRETLVARAAALVTLLAVTVRSLGAQGPPRYQVERLDRATFVEEVRSEITTQSGGSERHRSVLRTAQFGVQVRGDTLIVTADTVHLTENADALLTTIDVDAVIGARWKLVLGARGSATVLDFPVVPQAIGDVSDVGTAMDDFFPPSPPILMIGARSSDSAGRKWQRLSDSAGVGRYQFTHTPRAKPAAANDTVVVKSSADIVEGTSIAWDPSRGPLSWTRIIRTTATTRFAGRTVRAEVEQRIAVHRLVAR